MIRAVFIGVKYATFTRSFRSENSETFGSRGSRDAIFAARANERTDRMLRGFTTLPLAPFASLWLPLGREALIVSHRWI